MSKKKKIIIVIVVVVLFALIGVGAFALMNYIDELKQKEDSSGLKTQSNVILDNNSEVNKEELVYQLSVNIRKKFIIEKNEDGKYVMEVNAVNDNEHQYMFTVTVEDKEIYRSDLIPAGATLPEVELDNVDLESGTYEAIVMFTVVNEKDNESVMGSSGVQIPLEVRK